MKPFLLLTAIAIACAVTFVYVEATAVPAVRCLNKGEV